MKNLIFTLLFSVFSVFSLRAQLPGIGHWRTHLPYNKVIDVAVAGDVIYAATPYDIYSYNTSDNNITIIDKVYGLHDAGISRIAYDAQRQVLLVAYEDGNIDLLDADGNVYNIPDIYNKDMFGLKTINNILFQDRYAYLSCAFGIVKLDLQKQEVKETYYMGPDGTSINVYDLTINDTAFVAATEKGIYYADKNASNLADFSQWHHENRIPNANQAFNLVASFNGKLYANYYSGSWSGDTLYVLNGSRWEIFQPDNHDRHFRLTAYPDKMILVNRNFIQVFNTSGSVIQQVLPIGGWYSYLSAQFDASGSLWAGTDAKGMLHLSDNGSKSEFILPNGPAANGAFDMDASGNQVWVVPGGYQSNWSKAYVLPGVFDFQDGKWNNFTKDNVPAFDSLSDMVCVKADPLNPGTAYVGTWQAGILQFKDNKLTNIFSKNNSSLEPWTSDTNLVNVSGMDFDSQHNLWVANTGAYHLLSMRNNNGSWKSFYLGSSLSGIDVSKLMVDSYDQIWIIKRNNGMVIVYNDNNTPADASDDQWKVLTSVAGNGNIPGNVMYSMATDKNGAVWVGTDKGVAVFYNPENIFQPGADYDAQQILVPRNDGTGLADILLVTETVTAIAVDGGNRKWIGTERSGVFLLSPDGLKQIHHFTAENSPLLSNHITGITISKDGEVFMGTDQGLISYRGTATPGNETFQDVYAFPNPVRESYTGPIAIKGLVTNASVKITDAYGNLVYETVAEGGQAIWDGKNFDHQRVATGVYLVFLSNSDGSQTLVTKILVIH
ncbi:MAG: hypothetical protein JXR71_10390 [Bacteroidales bacterium]|nr:hypothetical protein [Bacteroidales bacterium]